MQSTIASGCVIGIMCRTPGHHDVHSVERGSKLLTIEAMKMQSNIYAPITGRVSKLLVAPGQHVEAKDLLVMIVP